MKKKSLQNSKKLNLRQRRFVAEFTDPQSEGFGNQTKAAKLAGYSELAPGQAGHQILKNSDVLREIERVMDKAGATREKVAQVLNEGLEAGITRVFCQEGEVIYSEPLIDHPTRVRTAEVISKLRGDYAPMKLDVTGLEGLPQALTEGLARKNARE